MPCITMAFFLFHVDGRWCDDLIPLNLLNLKGKPWWVVPVVRFMHCCASEGTLGHVAKERSENLERKGRKIPWRLGEYYRGLTD